MVTEKKSEVMAAVAQEPHVKIGAHALQRLYDGAPGTSQSDIMMGSGSLSREVLLSEFFKVVGATPQQPKK
jgi:hypothetical protein